MGRGSVSLTQRGPKAKHPAAGTGGGETGPGGRFPEIDAGLS